MIDVDNKTYPKISIIGNCQARPVESLLRLLYKTGETKKIIVHLAKEQEAPTHEQTYEDSDIIISQMIHDQYPCHSVRTNTIKEKHSSKLILIPNLYYRGYNPDLRYLRLSGKGTLTGPLGDYHSKILLDCWKKGICIDEAIAIYRSQSTWKELYKNTAEESLNELRAREKILDIKITNLIRKSQAKRQLFYTFNHPSNFLLTKMVHKIGKLLNLSPTNDDPTHLSEPLSAYRAPIHPFTRKQLAIEFNSPSTFASIRRTKDNKNISCEYSLKKIGRRYYNHYNVNKSDIDERAVW